MRDVTREQVIAYRIAAQQFDRSVTSTDRLAVLDIGVQEAMGVPAAFAFDARLPRTPDTPVGPGHRLALVWSLRGAPHVHRRSELNALTDALYPLSEADAAGRLNETGPSVSRAGISATKQFAVAAKTMRAVVRASVPKGDASTNVSARLPPVMLRDCSACKAKHISDSAMRATSLAAGLELEPGTAPPVLLRRTGTRLVTEPDPAALQAIIVAYLTLLGPATSGDVAGYLGARRADVDAHWPDGLVEVRAAGRKAWLPQAQVDALQDAPPPDLVRLLGAFDPYLQARDRSLIVPDTSVHKAMWPVLGRPGAVFVDGEVVGTWRPKTSGRKVRLHVEAWAPLPPAVWTQVEDEAQRIGTVRGASETTVTRVA